MKRIMYLLSASALLAITHQQTSLAVEVIDEKTVYAPKINICVSSFGGSIQSPEIVVAKNNHQEIIRTKELLTRWIYDSNSAGFYLQQFDESQFYWQFVETKKYIGAILIVTDDPINQKFYQTLGSGLNVCGKEFYGLDSPSGINGDLFSFVVCKQDYVLCHFEDWKFSEQQQQIVSTAHTHKLLSKTEQLKLARAPRKIKTALGQREIIHLASNDQHNTKILLKRDSLPQISK